MDRGHRIPVGSFSNLFKFLKTVDAARPPRRRLVQIELPRHRHSHLSHRLRQSNQPTQLINQKKKDNIESEQRYHFSQKYQRKKQNQRINRSQPLGSLLRRRPQRRELYDCREGGRRKGRRRSWYKGEGRV